MAESTGISWADATFNPWVGCTKVSKECKFCYAETMVTGRMGRPGTWGPSGTRERTSVSLWKKPLRWNTLAAEGLLPDGSENRDGHRPRVFCASLADVFEPRPELEPWRLELFALIEQTPNLDWLLLTKRPEEARDWLRRWYESASVSDLGLFGREWVTRERLGWGVLPNVWVGASIGAADFTWRADVLREIPATVRFISAEPLLGSLFQVPASSRSDRPGRAPVADDAAEGSTSPRGRAPLDLTGIDWVIVGGESGGRDARPMHPQWAREIRDAVFAAETAVADYGAVGLYRRPAFHFKQFGSWAPAERGSYPHVAWIFEDGRVVAPVSAEATRAGDTIARMRYAGSSPKSGGKLLDGIEWCEFPETIMVSV